MKRQKIHHWQRLSTIGIAILILLLLWPFLGMKGFKEFWLSTRFQIPNPPHIQTSIQEDTWLPKTFVLVLKSNDMKLLAHLQQGGWPAYLSENKIFIGPYLESFHSQVNLDKIKQMTSIPVMVENNVGL